MFNLFSERQGIMKDEAIKTDEMPDDVRKRLWNKVRDYIDNLDDNYSSRNDAIKYLWDRFFKQDIDTLRREHGFDYVYFIIDQIKTEFFLLKWYGVCDFLEFLLSVQSYKKTGFVKEINQIFLDERLPYKIIENFVTPLISGNEAEEVRIAIESKYSQASGHIKKALEFYRKRPVADYKNSIKESISSIEALSRIILNKPGATLGELSQSLDVHPSFKRGISALYGWTSDVGGVRHSENGKELNIGEAEARFMLIECSALVNYVSSKYSK